MWRSLLLIVATLHVISTQLIHFEKETVFRWTADIKAGTHLPAKFASQFQLTGKIHLQPKPYTLHVKITDLTYKIYNGVVDHFHETESHEVPLPEEVKDLERVFKIVYNEDVLVEGIVFDKNEKEFSKNIKKAVATILQGKLSILKKNLTYPETFQVEEDSIYGKTLVDYAIYPKENDTLEVSKLHDFSKDDLSEELIDNSENNYCRGKSERIIMRSSEKSYFLVKEEGKFWIENVTSVGTIVYYPYLAKSDSQVIMSVQKFERLEVVPILETYKIEIEAKKESLTYHSYNSLNGVVDLTNGRQVINYDKLVPEVVALLKEVPQYLSQDHINTEAPEMKHHQLINKIQSLLSKFPQEKLEELHQLLDEKTLNVFIRILPIISSEASTLYIKNLIVDRKVDVDTGMDLVKRFHENISPSVEVLSEVEDLLHLNDSFSWRLRKPAILNFATLIHKSYQRTKNQKLYEGYVQFYLGKLEGDYRTQQVFLFGLRNMKLPIILDHLESIFRDSSQSEHLRFLSMWAAAPLVLKSENPDLIIEKFWPIFTNRNELTEMRIVSYYYIMHSQPSYSRLKNIYSFMMTEPNQELYHMHYTFLKSMVESKSPCHDETRVKLAQILKFTPPPKHGVSSATYHGYSDQTYKFGYDFEDHMINTNRSRIYGNFVTSHHFNQYQEEFMIYVKVHYGHPVDLGHSYSLYETLFNVAWNGDLDLKFDTEDKFIEVAIMKRGQVTNSFLFDKNNLHELKKYLEISSWSQTFSKEWLYIGYEWYDRAVIPTDVGFPALWEVLVPDVTSFKLEWFINKLLKRSVKIDFNYKNWVHYRHGLIFYNPVGDVWQGINRYHTYDASLPLNLEISKDVGSGTVKLKWRKHVGYVSGIRSHVQQAVFVSDGAKLVQSSPKCQEYVVVEYEPTRHNYTILHLDHLPTAHKYYVGVYDSTHHLSKGLIKHHLHLFTDRSNKYSTAPSGTFGLITANLLRYIYLLPDPAQYGFILRIEPTEQHSIDSIELTYSVQKLTNDPPNTYLPDSKRDLQVAFKVSNELGVVASWSFKSLISLNTGHSFGTLKAYLTHSSLSDEEYKICLDGSEKWLKDGFTGRLGVKSGQGCAGKRVVDLTLIGKRSKEQIEGGHQYPACEYVVPYSAKNYYTADCWGAPSRLRNYQVLVKTKNLEKGVKDFLYKQWMDWVKDHQSYFLHVERRDEKIGEGNIEIDVEFPMQDDQVDLRIKTAEQYSELSGVPSKVWKEWGVVPYSTAVSEFIVEQHEQGWSDHCYIHHNHHSLNGVSHFGEVPNEWSLYLQHNPSQDHFYLKLGDNQTIGLKITSSNHSMEVVPHEHSYQIVIDGLEVPLQEQYQLDWVYFRTFVKNPEHPLFVLAIQSGVIVNYDVRRVGFVTSKTLKYGGRCFNKN